MKVFIVRRRLLGMSSGKNIAKFSKQGIKSRKYARDVPKNTDILFRWGCTAQLPIQNVVNTVEAIHKVTDKTGFRKLLNEHNLCPPTYFKIEDVKEFPVILRPKFHSRGRNIHFCRNKDELIKASKKYNDFYISDFIKKEREYRVFIVQGRAVCVAEKIPANKEDIAWNVAKGGKFVNVRWDDWPLKAIKNSIEAFNLSGLDFGGVDIMVDANGVCYVIEINSAPSLTSPYRQECMAKAFDYIVINGKNKIPLIDKKGGYKKFIHPAINKDAKVNG